MTKVRKVKRKKRFRMNVNRKRLRNKLRKLPTVQCPQIEQSWEVTMSTRSNLKQMGLAYDSNEVLKIPNAKRELIKKVKRKLIDSEDISDDEEENMNMETEKSHIAKELEADAKAPRIRTFKLPNNQVQFLTYLMDKYGEDYEAMARDKKNYNQLTWKQIRAKIKVFKGIPEQYNQYLQNKMSNDN
ncbi:nucleolar protein 16 [Hylaeus anthracinus]|uniref:nucleolar protein 16 n=1 Tax=Hylaeus volcanicus TaxID=313075 RepID=UPI0023B8750E|nr:nucleolar protein 16 [Hylaeus volcanicus]XP_053997822.1 nucleolar protein 16 [Hylaeus anthracinus]